MDPSDIPRLASHVRAGKDRFSGELLLLAPEKAIMLNSTAQAVLGLCDGVHTLESLVMELATRYDTKPDALYADVMELVTDLIQKGLVTLEKA